MRAALARAAGLRPIVQQLVESVKGKPFRRCHLEMGGQQPVVWKTLPGVLVTAHLRFDRRYEQVYTRLPLEGEQVDIPHP